MLSFTPLMLIYAVKITEKGSIVGIRVLGAQMNNIRKGRGNSQDLTHEHRTQRSEEAIKPI